MIVVNAADNGVKGSDLVFYVEKGSLTAYNDKMRARPGCASPKSPCQIDLYSDGIYSYS